MFRTFWIGILLTGLLIVPSIAQTPKTKPETIPMTQLVERFLQQPDYAADQTLTLNGKASHKKYAQKGKKIREVFYLLEDVENLKDESFRQYPLIALRGIQPTPVFLDPQTKVYADVQANVPVSPVDMAMLLRNLPAEVKQSNAVKLESVTIAGLKATHYRVAFPGEKAGLHFYVSDDPSGLLLKFESDPETGLQGSFVCSNISFEIPDEWFQIPSDYRKVELKTLMLDVKQKATR
ncbi:MAG: hypothetical protein K1Y36_02405 [Blastocatellia bacterium]|nr:hypothetical protein [Blastocatellia bacterium]